LEKFIEFGVVLLNIGCDLNFMLFLESFDGLVVIFELKQLFFEFFAPLFKLLLDLL
jgi:hypothetical protein